MKSAMSSGHLVTAAAIVALLGSPLPSRAQVPGVPASVTPGELVIDPPTLINLGFKWLIEGDGNRNASVEVSYRAVGESGWRR